MSPNNQKKKKIPTVLDVEKKNGRTKKYLLSATIFSLFTLLFLFFQQKKKKKIAKIGDKTGNKNEWNWIMCWSELSKKKKKKQNRKQKTSS